MPARHSVFLALLLLTCIAAVTAQGPVIVQQIPDQPVPLNEVINLRTDFTHPDINENLILTVQQANGSPLPSGVTLTMKAPTFVGSLDTPGNAQAITVVGTLAYMADDTSGLQIIDVSTPSAPTWVGSYNTPGTARGITVVGNLVYVADDASGLQIIDVSTPSALFLVGSYNNTPGSAYDITVQGNLAYAADGTGLQIIDVSTPSAPTWVGSYNTPGTQGITVVGTLAYVANFVSGLQIIDVSAPSAPTWVGSYNTPGYAYGITVVGTLAYVADYDSGLQIIDVSTPSAPTWVGTYNTPGAAVGITVVGTLAYVADYYTLQIIDVSTPSAPTWVGSYNPGQAWGITVVGTLAYVADYGSGLHIIDVSQWQLSGTPTVQDSYTLAVNVEDSQGRAAAYNFTLSDLLLTNPLQNQSTAINAAFSVVVPSDTFTDPSDPPDPTLDYSAQSVGGGALPGWLIFTPSTRTFSGTPLSGNQGSYNIEVTATNDASATASDQFILTVTNRDPTQDNGLANQAVNVGATLNYAFAANTFSDGDNDPLTYTAKLNGGGALPTWVTFISGTRTFSGVPAAGDQGVVIIAVTANDGFGGQASDSFELLVNLVPILNGFIDNQDAVVGNPFLYTFPANLFTEPDGDPLTYSAKQTNGSPLPAWFSLDGSTRTFLGIPAGGDKGFLFVLLIASDPHGGSASVSFGIAISDLTGNNPPLVLVAIPDQTAGMGALWNFVVPANTFDDTDSDVLTYAGTLEGGSALPQWLTFDDQTRTFLGIPTTAEVIRITVRVDDGRGGFALDTFTLAIQDITNQPPVLLNQLPNHNVKVGSNFRYTVPVDTFYDANEDALHYTATQIGDKPLPGWLSFDGEARTFSGKPSSKDTKTYADRTHTIQVCVSDGEGRACSSFLLSVSGASEAQEVITVLIVLVSIASTAFGIYRNRAWLWNHLAKKYYQQPDRTVGVGQELSYRFNVPAEKIAEIRALKNSNPLPNGQRLPYWLGNDKADITSLLGTPPAAETITVCAYGYDGRILAAFKLIVKTDCAEEEGAEDSASQRKPPHRWVSLRKLGTERGTPLLDPSTESNA